MADDPDPRVPAFRRLLLAAAETHYYRARLGRLEGLLSTESIKEALAGILPADARAVQSVPEMFRSPRPHYRFPFHRQPGHELAGSYEQLLARRSVPRRAWRTVVWSLPGQPFGTAERDALWRAFELPVFEEVRGLDHELLAWECDAHDALHIEQSQAIAECLWGELTLTSLAGLRHPLLRVRTGRAGVLVYRNCGCGQEGLLFRQGSGLTADTSQDILQDVSR